MAIKINASGVSTKAKSPKAKAGAAQSTKTQDPLEQFIEAVGPEKFDRMIELQHQIEQMKPQMEELEELRKSTSKDAMALLDKGQKFYVQREIGLVEVPACSKSTVLSDKDLAIERLKEINPALVDECFTPAISKLKSYLSGPMAEGVFDTEYGKSRLPKVKPGK